MWWIRKKFDDAARSRTEHGNGKQLGAEADERREGEGSFCGAWVANHA